MEITTDVSLRGKEWNIVIDGLKDLFTVRRHYDIYILAMSLGIMYDKRIEKLDESMEDVKSVPRTVLINNDNGKLDLMFQAAILSTTTEDFTEDERLNLAFGENVEFNKLAWLTQFANYGITKLAELLASTTVETMEALKTFLCRTVEGKNIDVDELPDDLLLEE